jgi:hypothetical protein
MGAARSAQETGRVSKDENNAFFACSLIEYIARKTRNRSCDVVHKLGDSAIKNLFEYADTYHCESIDDVADRFIAQCGLAEGDFDNVAQARYAVPSHWDIGKVFKRLALGIAEHEGISIPQAIERAFCCEVAEKIEDYNSSFYYDSPQNILNAYLYGELEW